MSYSELTNEWVPEFKPGHTIKQADGTVIEVTKVCAEQVYLCKVTRPGQKFTEAFLRDMQRGAIP